MAKGRLYRTVREWQSSARDARDAYPYITLLDELSFQADLRFGDYVQYQQTGSFLIRLEQWLANTPAPREQQTLLRLLEHLIFIDDSQMTALYRDAFRRVIDPWLTDGAVSISDMLVPDYPERQRALLAGYQIASITESCNVGLLLKASDLHGMSRPEILGPNERRALAILDTFPSDLSGCVICEDIVGTGKQAGKILSAVEARAPAHWRLLFVPLIAFEDGVNNLRNKYAKRTTIRPLVVLPRRQCLRKNPEPEEPHVFKVARGVVKNTARRVLEPADRFDDPPRNPFGYEGTGGIIVTCHNAPNNTLPLIHHKAPSWSPLFRRLHHKERTS